MDLFSRAKELAILLTRRPSVNGSPGEAAFAGFLAEFLAAGQGDRLDVTSIAADGDPLARPVVIARLKGTTRARAVVVMGHYDTVGTADFGEHEGMAHNPEALLRLYAHHPDPAIRKDATAGRHLFGRGVLDMKSGLAAMVAALEALTAQPPLAGDVLFAFCPDEEADSRGARTLRRFLHLEEESGRRLLGCINTDYASPGAGGSHAVFLGSVGKVLPAVFVGGSPTHATEPDGLSEPASLLAAVVHEVTFHPALRDHADGQDGPPPVVLHLEDSRTTYDVQTLSHAWAYFNVISLSRTPDQVFEVFHRTVKEALARAWEQSAGRLRSQGYRAGPGPTVTSWKGLSARLEKAWPGAVGEILDWAALEDDPRQRSLRIVEEAWHRLGAPPMAVTFFAQEAIPRVAGDGGSLLDAARSVADRVLGGPLAEVPFFPAISDMSFVARSPDEAADGAFRANFPAGVAGSSLGPAPAMPVMNVGPEGQDAHRPTERVEMEWSCGRLPELLFEILRHVLA